LQRLKVLVTEQENRISGTRVDLRPLKDQFADAFRTAKEGGGLADRTMGNTLMTWLQSKADMVSYPVAKAMRTEIRNLQEELRAEGSKRATAIGKADSMYDALTKQIRKGLAEDDPFLAQMWDEANLMEAGGQQNFNNKFIQELVKMADVKGANNPEAIAEKVWNPKQVTPLKVVRNALSDTGPETWRKLQETEMEKMLRESRVNPLDPASPPDYQQFQDAFFGRKGERIPMLEAGFDKATVNELQDLYEAIRLGQEAKTRGKPGSVLIQLSQGRYAAEGLTFALTLGGALSDYGAELSGAAGAVLLGPKILAKIMTTPGGIRWLTEGLTTSPTSRRGIVAGTQILRVLQGAIPRTMEAPTPPAPTPTTTLPSVQNVQ